MEYFTAIFPFPRSIARIFYHSTVPFFNPIKFLSRIQETIRSRTNCQYESLVKIDDHKTKSKIEFVDKESSQ